MRGVAVSTRGEMRRSSGKQKGTNFSVLAKRETAPIQKEKKEKFLVQRKRGRKKSLAYDMKKDNEKSQDVFFTSVFTFKGKNRRQIAKREEGGGKGCLGEGGKEEGEASRPREGEEGGGEKMGFPSGINQNRHPFEDEGGEGERISQQKKKKREIHS